MMCKAICCKCGKDLDYGDLNFSYCITCFDKQRCLEDDDCCDPEVYCGECFDGRTWRDMCGGSVKEGGR